MTLYYLPYRFSFLVLHIRILILWSSPIFLVPFHALSPNTVLNCSELLAEPWIYDYFKPVCMLPLLRIHFLSCMPLEIQLPGKLLLILSDVVQTWPPLQCLPCLRTSSQSPQLVYATHSPNSRLALAMLYQVCWFTCEFPMLDYERFNVKNHILSIFVASNINTSLTRGRGSINIWLKTNWWIIKPDMFKYLSPCL